MFRSAISLAMSSRREHVWNERLQPFLRPLLGRRTPWSSRFRAWLRLGGPRARSGWRRYVPYRPPVCARRLEIARARLDRRAAAPRLRDHQADRGENERLVQPKSGRGLSDAHLSRRGGLPHLRKRGQQEALPDHARGRELSQVEP